MDKNINKSITISILRFLDDYLGLLLCAVLTVFKSLQAVNKPANQPGRILVMKFWEGGCIILLYPYLTELKRKYPDAKTTLFTLSDNKEICDLLKVADEVVAVDFKAGVFNFVCQMFRQVIIFRREKYDLLLDLEFLSRSSAAISHIISAGFSIGFCSPHRRRGRIHDTAVLFNEKVHVMENFRNVFLSAGIDAAGRDPGKEGLPVIKEALVPGGTVEGEYVVVNLNRNGFINQRCWPVENYEAVIQYLIDSTSYKIAGISSEGFEDIKFNFGPRFINLTGKLDYSQLAGLLKGAKLFITHDSGPMHLAAALGTPTVS